MRRVFASAQRSTAPVAAAASVAVAAARSKYSPLVEEHYRHPRNVGKLDKADPAVGVALRGAPECGDMVQIGIKVNDQTQVIEDVKVKAFGCASAIASTSYASEVLRGKTLSEAQAITNADIAAELSLPPVKLHCSMLAEETIKAAVDNYLHKQPALKHKVIYKEKADAPAAATAE